MNSIALQKFRSGPTVTVRRLNQMVDAINALHRLTGDGLIETVKTPEGHTLRLNMERVKERMPRHRLATGLSYATIETTPTVGDPVSAPPVAASSKYTLKLLPLSETPELDTEYDAYVIHHTLPLEDSVPIFQPSTVVPVILATKILDTAPADTYYILGTVSNTVYTTSQGVKIYSMAWEEATSGEEPRAKAVFA